MKKILLVLTLTMLLILPSCGYFKLMSLNEWRKKSGNDGYNIYICGISSTNNACYWKNGKIHEDLENGRGGMAWDIFVYDNNVYTSGYDGTNACYWKNDNYYPLDGTFAYSITVVNGDVYTSGFFMDGVGYQVACYWVNQTRHELPGMLSSGTGYTGGSSIFAVDKGLSADVYVCGAIKGNEGCYWKNDEIKFSGGSNIFNSIYVYNDDVYFCQNGTEGGYYKNSTFMPVANPPLSISVDKGDVYLLFNSTPVQYSKNNNITTLEGTSITASSMFIYNNDVFVVGNETGRASYWINGKLTTISATATFYSVYVSPKFY